MSTAIVNSFNIFVDSGRCITSQSTGDDIHLLLSQTPIHCADNQSLRLTLQDFNMVKNFTNVNEYNSRFLVKFHDGLNEGDVNLDHQNYSNVHDVANNFAKVLANKLKVRNNNTAPAITNVTPVATSTAHGNTDNIISFDLTFSVDQGVLDQVYIKFPIEYGDTYELLGGLKIVEGDITTAQSVEYFIDPLSTGNKKLVKVTCYFPAQRFTEEHIYLRTDLPSTNLETMSYSAKNSDDNNAVHINNSRILGKVPITDNVCQFHTSTGNEYSVHLKQKNFTMMNLKLTDSHGRKIPVIYPNGMTRDTALKKGNFNFKCTIKCEIVQNMGGHNNHLQTEHPQKTVSARFGTEPLPYFDYGGNRKNR